MDAAAGDGVADAVQLESAVGWRRTLRLTVEQSVDAGDPAIDRTGAQGVEGFRHRHSAVLDHDLRRAQLHSRARELMAEGRHQAVARGPHALELMVDDGAHA